MLRLIFGIFLVTAFPVWAEDTEHTISVTGVGTVTTVPDIARVRLGVSSDARTAREAMAQNSTAMAALLDVLGKENVALQDIQTTNLSLFPSFENRTPGKSPTVVGYRAQNLVTLLVRDLPNLGRILDQVTQVGGNLIQSIQFDRNETDALMDEARREAVLDAKARAELYAQTAGIAVGPVISITEGGDLSRPQPMAMARAEAMDVPIAEGQLTLSARVHVIFLIE